MYYGLTLIAFALVLSYFINPLTGLLMSIGIADNVIIYSKLLKRRNPANIILGGFSGGFQRRLNGNLALNLPQT